MQRVAIGILALVGATTACSGSDLGEDAASNLDPSSASAGASDSDTAPESEGESAADAPSNDASPSSEELSGEQLFRSARPDGNTFTCSTCHSLPEATDVFRRAGHPLENVLLRPSFKNGALDEARLAVNSCLDEWMGAAPWDADSEEWAALSSYFEEQQTETEAVEPLSFEIVPPPEVADMMAGVPSQGRALFNETCASCHGEDAAGTQQAPQLRAGLSAELVARRVRTSGLETSQVYEGLTGGRMPFWSKERLSDEELSHLVAFVLAIDSVDATPDEPGDPDPTDPPPADDGCGSDHPKVGQSGMLSNKAHGVSGTVTVVDNCTLEVSAFEFDGGGIDVRLYSGNQGNFSSGAIIGGENLVRTQPYSSETIRVPLNDGVSLDDFDSVSVWCVPIGISFGDTILAP